MHFTNMMFTLQLFMLIFSLQQNWKKQHLLYLQYFFFFFFEKKPTNDYNFIYKYKK